LPWIGKSYNEANRKLLIVGESHYKKADSDEKFEKYLKEPQKIKNLQEKPYMNHLSAVNGRVPFLTIFIECF